MPDTEHHPDPPLPSGSGGTSKTTVLVKIISVAIKSTDSKENSGASAETTQLPHATLTFPEYDPRRCFLLSATKF